MTTTAPALTTAAALEAARNAAWDVACRATPGPRPIVGRRALARWARQLRVAQAAWHRHHVAWATWRAACPPPPPLAEGDSW